LQFEKYFNGPFATFMEKGASMSLHRRCTPEAKASRLSTIAALLCGAMILLFAAPGSTQTGGPGESLIVNVNPDPNGEPWIAGGINQDEWAASVAAMPLLGTGPTNGLGKVMALPIPSKIDNTIYPSFRPIFNQQGGSCATASSIGYVFTYEINYLRGLPANVPGNQYPYDFTYNFLNNGSGNNEIGRAHV
jgi:hypothetical protein